MKYVGGKSAQAKYYLPQITKILEKILARLTPFTLNPFLEGEISFVRLNLITSNKDLVLMLTKS